MISSVSGSLELSVVVPAYNRRDLVRRAVGSLLEQDLDAPYEVVVVDDGSTDGTAEAVEGMDSRVRVVRQPNRGAAVARHTGVEAARGPVVAFHDSDDVAPPCKLSTLLGALKAHPQCVMSFGVTHNRKWEEGRAIRWIEGPLDGRTVIIEDPFVWLLRNGGPIAEAMNLATYRELCRSCSRGRSFYRAANDYDLQIRLARHGNFVHVARVTCIYASQNEGISNSFGEFRQGAFALCSADEAFRHSSRSQPFREAIRQRVEAEWPRFALGLFLTKDWQLFRRILELAGRHSRIWHSPRAFWWALDNLVETRGADFPRPVVHAVQVVRGLRSGVLRRWCQQVQPVEGAKSGHSELQVP